jgi:hypothetical protein
MTVLVKKLSGEKVGNVSKCGHNCYVNERCIILVHPSVEKSCGEVCGKCGKVLLFHRETTLYQHGSIKTGG